MNRLTRFLTAAGLALLLTLAARAENPDGKGPGSRPCCKPCGECGRAGVSEGTATNDASYWNFLSGRLEQHVVLSTRHHGLALAERALRHCVIDRKVTQGTRGETGERWCECVWTVVSACRKQGRSAFEFFREALRAYTNGSPAPSLLKNP